MMVKKTLDYFMENGRYLPPILRDFHDQKDLFKTIFMTYKKRLSPEDTYLGGINWVMAHIFTIDIFLWFMARHGYTLQKSRQSVDFEDLSEDIREGMKQWRAPLRKFLEGDLK